MKLNSPTAAIVLLKKEQKKRSDGAYPVKLRIYYNKGYKLYSIVYKPEDGKAARDAGRTPPWEAGEVIAMTEAEYNNVFADKPKGTYYYKNVFLMERRAKAITIIEKLGQSFTYPDFEAQYTTKAQPRECAISALKAMETASKKELKIGTASIYSCAYRALQAFSGKDTLSFNLITPTFLKEFESWMLQPRKKGNNKTVKANSKSTVSIYVRALRAAWNRSNPQGVKYPFGKRSASLYAIPKTRNIKKALSQADISKIASYTPIDGSMEHRSRDLWLFSYLANGMNFKDVALLRWRNIEGDHIRLVRAKTKNTTEEETTITVIVTRQIGRILDRWSVKPVEPDGYIFPILHPGMTAEQQHKAVYQMIKNTNKYMKRICEVLELPPVTTYHARHSFATVLKRSGASIEFISESLGHRSIGTTMAYLDSFESDQKRKWANILLPDPDEKV